MRYFFNFYLGYGKTKFILLIILNNFNQTFRWRPNEMLTFRQYVKYCAQNRTMSKNVDPYNMSIWERNGEVGTIVVGSSSIDQATGSSSAGDVKHFWKWSHSRWFFRLRRTSLHTLISAAHAPKLAAHALTSLHTLHLLHTLIWLHTLLNILKRKSVNLVKIPPAGIEPTTERFNFHYTTLPPHDL